MNDLQLARAAINRQGMSLVIVLDSEILYSSLEPGLKPTVEVYKEYREIANGAVLGDKIIGKAAAMIIKDLGFKSIYTNIISQEALEILDGIEIHYNRVVPNVLNKSKTDLCPMEKLANSTDDLGELIWMIEEFWRRNEKN